MKNVYMNSALALSLLVLIGGGCVTVTSGPAPEGSAPFEAMKTGGSVPEAPTAEDPLFGATSPLEFGGMWVAPELGKTISFDSSSGDNGNGMFHVDGMEGYNSAGIWYIQNDLLNLTTYDNKTVNVHYKYGGISDTEITLQTLTGEDVTWTKK